MRRLSHSAVALILGLALLNAVDGWRRVAERAGLAAPSVVSRPLLSDALARQARVKARLAATLERRQRAEELATGVLEGRLTMREGAAGLREMYRAAPDF